MGIADSHRARVDRVRGSLSVFRTVHGTRSPAGRFPQVLRDVLVGRVQSERWRRWTADGRGRPARRSAGRPRRRKVQGICHHNVFLNPRYARAFVDVHCHGYYLSLGGGGSIQHIFIRNVTPSDYEWHASSENQNVEWIMHRFPNNDTTVAIL